MTEKYLDNNLILHRIFNQLQKLHKVNKHVGCWRIVLSTIFYLQHIITEPLNVNGRLLYEN